jgi:hypothetical protein
MAIGASVGLLMGEHALLPKLQSDLAMKLIARSDAASAQIPHSQQVVGGADQVTRRPHQALGMKTPAEAFALAA